MGLSVGTANAGRCGCRAIRGRRVEFVVVMGWATNSKSVDRLRRVQPIRRALVGVNAAVVGLLLAALYDPVWTSAIFTPGDFGLALAAFVLLVLWKIPPWLVVILCAAAGAGLGML